MELRHLRYFVAVAESGSLSRAAEKLFIAQPPLSVQIRQLEEMLGTALFARHPKGVRLTAAGQVLLPEARFLLDRAARLRDLSRDSSGSSTLAIGYVPSAASTVVPELVRRLRRQQPGVQFELREAISSEQVDLLVAGHIDVGIARTPARHPRLTVARQMPDPFCLALPRAQAQGLEAKVDLRRFATESFVGFTRHRGPAYFDHSIHLCSQAGFSPRIRYEGSTVHGVLDLVGAGLGVALVPASTALLAGSGVVVRALRRPGAAEVLVLLRRKVDAQPLLEAVETAAEAIFDGLQQKVARLIAP